MRPRIRITENSLANPHAAPKTAARVGRCAARINSLAELLIDINHSTASDYRRELSLDEGDGRVALDPCRGRRNASLEDTEGTFLGEYGSK